MLAIGSCSLSDRPRIALAVQDQKTLEISDIPCFNEIDIIELRIDKFSQKDEDYIRKEIQRYSIKPTIGTIRNRQEGGDWQGTEEERLNLFLKVIPWVDAIDIELSADDINHHVIEMAHQHHKMVIGSFHDFGGTPQERVLYAHIDKGRNLGTDMVKIATYCSSSEDLRILAKTLLDPNLPPLIVLGMGVYGMPSRVLFPALGSLLTYTFLDTPTAPGQLSLQQTLDFFNILYPANVG